ncbi:MAG TPA: rod shape-determining protein MreD [Rubrobacteraceae bacterium]|nr:rod shape-determining protein MreD [Rubrobacteraceae bacterium]
MEQTSVVRAALIVAAAALVDAVLVPYLTFGWISPNLTLLAIVFAVAPLRDLQAVLIGFFGGILLDALGGGLFGAGALGGLVAGTLAIRLASSVRHKGTEKFVLAQVVALSVAAYDLIQLAAVRLAGLAGPPLGQYIIAGALPDALLNALLAYAVGAPLLRITRPKPRAWDGA